MDCWCSDTKERGTFPAPEQKYLSHALQISMEWSSLLSFFHSTASLYNLNKLQGEQELIRQGLEAAPSDQFQSLQGKNQTHSASSQKWQDITESLSQEFQLPRETWKRLFQGVWPRGGSDLPVLQPLAVPDALWPPPPLVKSK